MYGLRSGWTPSFQALGSWSLYLLSTHAILSNVMQNSGTRIQLTPLIIQTIVFPQLL